MLMRRAIWHRFAAWLALAAISLQVGLSLGHIHADGFLAATDRGAQVDMAAPDRQPSNGGGDAALAANHVCDICVAAALLGAGALPAAPSLALPGLAAQPLDPVPVPGLVSRRFVHPPARGPPVIVLA